MHRKPTRRIWGILKKSEFSLAVRRRRVTFASSQWPCDGCHTFGGGSRWKSQNRKNVYLSPYVETFNSKVIKGFLPKLRSRYVFFVFQDSYVLCTYVMNILCRFHISVSWVCYIIFIYLALPSLAHMLLLSGHPFKYWTDSSWLNFSYQYILIVIYLALPNLAH